MVHSPARRHLQRVEAARAAARTAAGQPMPGTGIYEQMLLQLASDRARLKQIQSGEGKARLKAELLPAYDPYVDGVLAEGLGAQDEVISTVMLWHIDAGSFTRALELARYVLAHGLKMPDRFERTTGCVVAEEVAEAALSAQRTGAVFELDHLDTAVALSEGQDMPDQVRAKLLLARARTLLANDAETAVHEVEPPALEAAIADLRRAIALHDSCGGKKDLERAERLLKKRADSVAQR